MKKDLYETPDLVVLNGSDDDGNGGDIMPMGVIFVFFVLAAGILVIGATVAVATQLAAAVDGVHVVGNVHAYINTTTNTN